MTVQGAYDRLAPHYRSYAQARAAYLDAVDDFVLARASRGTRMLDVGSGDGIRAAGIAKRLGATRLVLCDSSAQMAARCRALDADAVWETSAECLPETGEQFETITCLWNVLGHVPDPRARIAALVGMRRLLAPGGVLFCDVNNRHNARAYGTVRVMMRCIQDVMAPDERRGDSNFEWNVAGEQILVRGHLFTPAEIQRLFATAGLDIEQRIAIDYLTGAESKRPWEGQLVYRVCTGDQRRTGAA